MDKMAGTNLNLISGYFCKKCYMGQTYTEVRIGTEILNP